MGVTLTVWHSFISVENHQSHYCLPQLVAISTLRKLQQPPLPPLCPFGPNNYLLGSVVLLFVETFLYKE